MIRLFKNYEPGSNLTLLNVIYHRPYKDPNTEKWTNGAITLIAKDLDKQKKVISVIDDPLFEFYMADENDPELEDYYHSEYEKDKLHLVECKYRDRDRFVAEKIGRLDEYYDNLRMGQRARNNEMHIDNRIFRSLMHIEDFYRYKFGQTYQNNPYPLHKGYIDIETDETKTLADHAELGEVPINAVTFIDHFNRKSYTFLLEDKQNESYHQFKRLCTVNMESVTKEIWEKIIESLGGDSSKIEKFNLTGMQFNLLFYEEDEELKMLKDLFTVINESGIDFLLAWNMAFDIPCIIQRIINLGADPREIMCHPSFRYKEASYTIDEKNFNSFHLRGDYMTISAPWVGMDQLLAFSGRRKGKITSFPNFKLDTIANIMAGTRKLDWSHLVRALKDLPSKSFKIFTIYNIVDVIAQIAIEEMGKDIDYAFTMHLETNTRYSKIHKPSVFQYNEAIKLYEEKLGLICGNNENAIVKLEEDKIGGGYVSDPRLLGDYAKLKLNDVPIMVCDNVCDEDFTSMYPSELMNQNMSNKTMIGKVDVLEQCYENDDYLHNKTIAIMNKGKEDEAGGTKYNRGGAFVEDLSVSNWIIFGSRWLGLKNFMNMYKHVIEYYTHHFTHATIRDCRGNIVEKKNDIKKIPFWFNTNIQYEGKPFMNRERPPFRYTIPVEESVRERLVRDFAKRKSF